MNWRGHCCWVVLALGWLGSSLLASAQAPPALRQPVRLTPGRRSLGAVLAELSRQSRLPFSYSSSLVPLAHRYQVQPGPARPAGSVLREVLAAEHLAYGVLDGQVVLWPNHLPTPPGVTAVRNELDGAEIAGTDKARAITALRPLANATPTSPPSARPLTLPGVAKTTARPAARRLPNSKAAFRATTLPSTLVAGNTVKATINRPGTTPGYNTVPQPARRGRVAARIAAATSQPVSPATSPRATTASGLRLGDSVPARVGKLGGAASIRASHDASAGAETSYAVSADVPFLAPLPLKSVNLELVSQAGPLPSTLKQVELATIPAAQTAPDRPLSSGPNWKSAYLHGEAWASESLPVGAVAKVGVARAYLVLGVAVAATGRGVGGAWGVGLGTAGRARGRFTPSLDVVHWFLGHDGDEDARPTSLTQLRPLLAWQLRREGRWALLLGPTLNLATADSHGAQRGGFGHNQWLLVDKDDEHSSVRFWPGVQVGLRF